MTYDNAAAQKKYRAFKSRLTRLKNLKDHRGIIALWQEFESYYHDSPEPMPDLWRRWQRAAEDAAYTLRREGGV